jgi:chloramphenicol O-acetyltransferase type A
MRSIDMATWPRRNHFRLFNGFDHPHFNMSVNVDVSAFQPFVKRNGHSLTVSMVYLIARTANGIPEFRQRIRGDQVVEHEIVNPGFSILVDGDVFGFCNVPYAEAFGDFARSAAIRIAQLKAHPDLEHDLERDDVLYMSPIPWVSFTSFSHPMQLHPADSVPRFAWGKLYSDGGVLRMPLSVQGHHAVMDGIHMGRFYEQIQESLLHPDVVLGAA